MYFTFYCFSFFHDPLTEGGSSENKLITINSLEDQMASIWQAFQDELGHKFKWISTATIKWENPERERERERERRERVWFNSKKCKEIQSLKTCRHRTEDSCVKKKKSDYCDWMWNLRKKSYVWGNIVGCGN